MDIRDFLGLFLAESREHLDGMSGLLRRAREGSAGGEAVNDLFRHAHSLKGMAASMGLRPMADLAHAMEDLFHAWRDRGALPAPETLERLQSACDRLAAQVDVVAAGGTLEPEADLVAGLRSAAAVAPCPAGPPAPAPGAPGAEMPAAASPGAEAAPGNEPPRLHLTITLNPDTPLPAARATVILRRLAEVGTIHDVSPPAGTMGSGAFRGPLRITLATVMTAARLRALVLDLPDVADCDAAAAPHDRRRADRRAGDERRADTPAAAEAFEGTGRAEALTTIRVATVRMDRLLDGIGELILDRERLKRVLGPREGTPEAAVLEDLSRTVETLRDEVVEMRMLPFSSIAPRLERVVRDLERRLGKQVTLDVQGTDVALDRSILEEMADPLQHILRNSIDHGIEDAAARRAAGKPPAGRIAISLTRRDDRVCLSVEDDGRGIDPAALRRVAVERRFLAREDAEALSDDQALMLITLPGFSTAARTTDISGRGVGMDVVLTQVRKLGGRLEVRSEVGHGTRFTMDLPPTVTVTRAFLCRDGGEIYAVPVSVVRSTVEVERSRLQTSRGEQVLQRGDEVVAVLPLRGLLRTGGASEVPAFPALVYREGEESFALAVEEILGEEEIVVKPLKHPLELLPQYAGAAVLNDGRIALILDPANLVRIARAA